MVGGGGGGGAAWKSTYMIIRRQPLYSAAQSTKINASRKKTSNEQQNSIKQ
jgi:hypothetical protein